MIIPFFFVLMFCLDRVVFYTTTGSRSFKDKNSSCGMAVLNINFMCTFFYVFDYFSDKCCRGFRDSRAPACGTPAIANAPAATDPAVHETQATQRRRVRGVGENCMWKMGPIELKNVWRLMRGKSVTPALGMARRARRGWGEVAPCMGS